MEGGVALAAKDAIGLPSHRGLSGVLFRTGSVSVIRDGCFRSLSVEVYELKELLVVWYIVAVFLPFEHGVCVEL